MGKMWCFPGEGGLTFLDIRGCAASLGWFFARNARTWVPFFMKKSQYGSDFQNFETLLNLCEKLQDVFTRQSRLNYVFQVFCGNWRDIDEFALGWCAFNLIHKPKTTPLHLTWCEKKTEVILVRLPLFLSACVDSMHDRVYRNVS